MGASYQEFSTITTPVPLTSAAIADLPDLRLPPNARAEGWADGLIIEGADVLGSYDDPFLGQFPAITTRAVGSGRMTWIGTLPDPGSAAAITRWALAERALPAATDTWSPRTDTVRINSGSRPDGSRLWFVANHSWSPCQLDLPTGLVLTSPIAGNRRVETPLHLTAWDSRVLLENARSESA